MQPMGRPKRALKVPCFSSFKVFEGGGVGKDFFPIFFGSQCVPTMFLLSSPSRMIEFLRQIQSHINTNKHLRSRTWHEALLNLKISIYEGFDIRLLSKKTLAPKKGEKSGPINNEWKTKKMGFQLKFISQKLINKLMIQ
jgi:hypothetical protein